MGKLREVHERDLKGKINQRALEKWLSFFDWPYLWWPCTMLLAHTNQPTIRSTLAERSGAICKGKMGELKAAMATLSVTTPLYFTRPGELNWYWCLWNTPHYTPTLFIDWIKPHFPKKSTPSFWACLFITYNCFIFLFTCAHSTNGAKRKRQIFIGCARQKR